MAPLRAAGFTGKIVIKSANQSSDERARYEASGADGSIDKVLMGEALKSEIAEILAGTWKWNAGPIDERVLGAADADEAAEHVRFFVQRAPELAQMACARFEAGSGARAWGPAHRLKALAGFVGARAVVEACEALRGIDAYHSEAAPDDSSIWVAKLARMQDATQDAANALRGADLQ